jgi:hypothetical protein
MGLIDSTRAVTVWSTLAMLAFIERALFDFRYVFPDELPGDPLSVGGAAGVYLLFVAAWIWALLAARAGGRGGLRTLIVLPFVTLIGLGVGTLTAFCPSPCETAWPLGELSNWVGLVVGIIAIVSATLALRRPVSEG